MERGWNSRFPTLEDWDIHLSTIFTEVRLKRYLEIRGADATPTPLTIAVPALWKGLLYDREALAAATEVSQSFPVGEIDRLSRAVAREGLRAEHRGRSVAAWCSELAAIAGSSLQRMAAKTGRPDESIYLDPLREGLEAGRSPAHFWPQSGSVSEVLARCEYR
jgi:glutamate--cysteine ligase